MSGKAGGRKGPSVRAELARSQRIRNATIATVAVLAAVGVLVVVWAVGGSSGGSDRNATPSGPLPPVVTERLGSVTPESMEAASSAEPVRGPSPIDAPALTEDGKPHVLYVGAEYCPFCAAERWAITLALSKFGTFQGLQASHSGSEDVFPDTATISFHGATYTSDLLAFDGVELRSNQMSGGQYRPLESLTAEQERTFSTYNSPPYVQAPGGSIPWIDLGGRYVHVGASFTPELLKGKTVEEIAAAVADRGSPIGTQVQSAAANYVRILCGLTGGRPADVCRPFPG